MIKKTVFLAIIFASFGIASGKSQPNSKSKPQPAPARCTQEQSPLFDLNKIAGCGKKTQTPAQSSAK